MVAFNWTRLPDKDFRELAAACIGVLLFITVVANAFAVFIRNRYSRAW
jgi:phosphate transport system permease protein